MITVEVDGARFDSFTRVRAEVRLDALSNAFLLETSSSGSEPLPIRGGDKVEVYADDELVVTGFAERVRESIDSNQHSITISGRDKTGDIVDSTLDAISDLRPPISLKTLVERVISHLGADIQVVDLAGAADFNAAEDLAAPDPGQNAFAYLEKLARKRRVLLTSNARGDVVLTQGSGERVDAWLVNRVLDDGSNNVLSSGVEYDFTQRFNRYAIASQLNVLPAALSGGDVSIESIVNQGRPAGASAGVFDEEIRGGRQLILTSESQFSDGEADERAKWEANVRKARSRVYSAVVDGYHNQVGALWTVNQLIRVDDEPAGIDSVMLVNGATFALDEDTGSTTALSLVNRDAYTTKLDEPEEKEVGLGFTLD